MLMTLGLESIVYLDLPGFGWMLLFSLSPFLSVYLHNEATCVSKKYRNAVGRCRVPSQAQLLPARTSHMSYDGSDS